MNPVPNKVGTAYGVKGDWAAGYHPGEDFLSPTGTLAVAPQDAEIVYAGWYGWGRAYGLTVIGESLINGQPLRWIMAHLNRALVRTGDRVQRGQQVAVTNNTGRTSGPHLHLEVRHFPYNYGDDVDPTILTRAEPLPPLAKPGTITTFDVSFWNVASPKWFTPWAPRAKGIGDEIKGEASVYGFAEVYDETQARSLQAALGDNFQRVSGHAGLEFWYDRTKWVLDRPVKAGGYPSGVQGRYALVVHLRRKETGQHVAFVVTHAPALSPALRTQFGAWLKKLLGQIDDPIVLMGDFNTGKNNLSPRSDIRSLGYRDMREQAAIVNEGQQEFPTKGKWLSDIYTIPGKDDHIIGGEIDLTAARLSDHRRIDARVTVKA